ncbi:hypothetical protein RHMOL_Rhmol08G0181400 [Rhododendron molle]|uniref:Uncharacterized protein n=1 Tax=Rhododendron molle TaxID=49168 RepID=A0ACC0MRP2_RHOML|nr:hypothetical protein RHMOL_Rhmol08G0181400 [Rhododendron molle]
MKPDQALGLDGFPIEVWKSLGDIGVLWLTNFFMKIIRTERCLVSREKSILVPTYKNKVDFLRKMTTVSENRFIPGRSTMEVIHLLR